MADRKCSVAGCARAYLARGLCDMHYQRLRKTGATELGYAERPGESAWTKYPGYSVTRAGLVFGKRKQLRQWRNRLGYEIVDVYTEGGRRSVTVHRMVAEAFIANPENKPEVNHKNSVRHDNREENLEWATRSENNKHAYISGRKQPQGLANHLSKPVEALDPKTGEVRHKFNCASEASRAGFERTCVSMACTGRRKAHRGLIWRFTEGG